LDRIQEVRTLRQKLDILCQQADTRVPQFRQLQRVTWPVPHGIDDSQTGQPGDVVDPVMDLHIHLRQGLVQMLDMWGWSSAPARCGAASTTALRIPRRPVEMALAAIPPNAGMQPLAFVPVSAPPGTFFMPRAFTKPGFTPYCSSTS
jgi:hypothetical protein